MQIACTWMTRWGTRWILACLVFPTVAAAACVAGPYPAFRSWVQQKTAGERWLEIAECIESQAPELEEAVAAEPGRADEYRYLLATAVSNSVESGPAPKFHLLAARHWAAYMTNVSPPFDADRLDFGIQKLTQHARKEGFVDFVEALWVGVRAVGDKLSGAFKSSSGATVLNTLYRCAAWDSPRDTAAADVCASDCRAHFDQFLAASAAFQNMPSTKVTKDQKRLKLDIDALKLRMRTCASS